MKILKSLFKAIIVLIGTAFIMGYIAIFYASIASALSNKSDRWMVIISTIQIITPLTILIYNNEYKGKTKHKLKDLHS